MFETFWASEHWQARLSLLVVAAMLIRATVRFIRVAWRLGHYSGEPISTASIVKGEISPDVLAEYALSRRVPSELAPDRSVGIASENCSDSATRALCLTRSRFLYLSGTCSSEIESAKQTGWLLFLIALITPASSAYPVGSLFCGDTDRPALLCLTEALDRMIVILISELLVCAVVYLATGF